MVQLEILDDALKLMRWKVVFLDQVLLLRMVVEVHMVLLGWLVWMEHFVSSVTTEYDHVKMLDAMVDMMMVLQHVMDALQNVVEVMKNVLAVYEV